MNFAYLDVLESILQPIGTEHPPAVPYTLDEGWNNFEIELGNRKMEASKAIVEQSILFKEYSTKKEDVNALKMMLDNVKSEGLKDTISQMIDNYESREGIPALALQCGEGAGKVDAMKKVLTNTNLERYAKFTCFVCMDRLVDLCYDPCGHVICETCFVRTRVKTVCPGCRTPVQTARKIYSMV